MATLESLHRAMTAAAGAGASAWLEEAGRALKASPTPLDTLLSLSARVRRDLGSAAGSALEGTLETPAGLLPLLDWNAADAARVLLLLHALEHTGLAPQPTVLACFKGGDEAERAGVIRGLALLPEPAAHKAVAQEAGRINSLHLYRALALNNPYPAGFYAEHEFNQLVLKALFTGLGIGRVVGLVRRANTELSMMCRDYVEERERAFRDVPRDIWLALAPCMDQAGEQQLLRYLEHDDPAHRYHAAYAARRLPQRSVELDQALARRKVLETEPDILSVLDL